MGMYRTKTADSDSLVLDTTWLKEHGYFIDHKSGGIKWTDHWGWESSISFAVNTEENPYINFDYIVRKDTEEEGVMNYRFPLVKVPCNLGGYRWAFRCGLYKNNIYCGKIVYKLYKARSDYFGCRKCIGIVYDSQRNSGSSFEDFGKMINTLKQLEELEMRTTKWHYQGRPTRNVRKMEKLTEELEYYKNRNEPFNFF